MFLTSKDSPNDGEPLRGSYMDSVGVARVSNGLSGN